jgi:outer membrane protein assembly factor BamB
MNKPFAASLAVGLACLPLAGPTSASNWPQFRGPGAAGIAANAKLPSTWNVESGENILWKTPIPGLGHSSPIVWDDLVFVTTAVREGEDDQDLKVGLYGNITPVNDPTPHRFELIALDGETGAVRWQRTAKVGIPQVKRHTKSSHASSTPVTDGKRVIAFFGSEGLYAWDMEGNLLWQKDFGLLDSGFFQVPSAQWGFASSPVIHDGRVIIQVDVQGQSFIAALDAATGEEIWRTLREEVPTWSTPAVLPRGEGLQVVANGWKHIGGYDFANGAELWKLEGGGDIPVPTPISAGDLILITSAHGSMRPIYAVRPDAAGDIRDTPAIAWMHEKEGNYMQTPIVIGNLAYFCFDNGLLSVFKIDTGERTYKNRLGTGNTGFSSSPVYGDGKIYIGDELGEVFVLAPGEEPQLLSEQPVELGETFMSTPAISGDRLLFRARRHLIAVGSRSAASP